MVKRRSLASPPDVRLPLQMFFISVRPSELLPPPPNTVPGWAVNEGHPETVRGQPPDKGEVFIEGLW